MALVHTNYHTNPLESSRLSQRELLARIFGHHGTEGEHNIDEDSSSDSGSDYEMEECHEASKREKLLQLRALLGLQMVELPSPCQGMSLDEKGSVLEV